DEVAERRVELGELPGLLAAVVLLPESGVEACLPAFGVGQLRVGGDEPREGFLRADSHRTDPFPDTQPQAGIAGARQVRARTHDRDYSSPVGRCSSTSSSRRSFFSRSASGRLGHGWRSVMIGGAARRSVTPVPNGRVLIRSGGRIATRRTERWFERVPWSPRVTESVYSSRSPIKVLRSWRSRLLETPPRMTLTMEASQIAPAALSFHLSRAWARDWSTGRVVIPVPPPSAISVGRLGRGARFPISSSASSRGGSRRAPGERAAIRRAVSMRSSTKAATRAADAPAPAPVARR